MEEIKNVVSVYTKTESGDEDLLLYLNVKGADELIEKMKEDFLDEFGYIDEVMVVSKGIDIDVSLIYRAVDSYEDQGY